MFMVALTATIYRAGVFNSRNYGNTFTYLLCSLMRPLDQYVDLQAAPQDDGNLRRPLLAGLG